MEGACNAFTKKVGKGDCYCRQSLEKFRKVCVTSKTQKCGVCMCGGEDRENFITLNNCSCRSFYSVH